MSVEEKDREETKLLEIKREKRENMQWCLIEVFDPGHAVL